MGPWEAEVGQVFLMLAFSLCLCTIVLAWRGTRGNEPRFTALARKGLGLTFLAVSGAMFCLGYALAKSHFEIAYVARVSNRDLPLFYKLAALWAGQAGSLLLWIWFLSLYGAIAAALGRRRMPDLLPWAIMIVGITGAFFLALNLFASNPFQLLREVFADGTERPFIPHDGQGLNPLLQHPAMMIHPPVLYLGFVGFTIPFAFAMAALIVRKVDSGWTASIRRWTLVSWLFLGTGIVLGGYWAYLELGWGGYWAWDPVENASLLPWLTATAFLHSIVVQQRRGMLKGWNFSLIAITYLLCLFGTFLTRSGVVSSVHAFGKSSIGPFFAVFVGGAAILSFALLLYRRRDLKGDHRFDALLSRESSFLYNNFLFLLICIAVLGGTLFPVISEWFTGNQITVGQEFYNRVFIPIGLLILFLMGAAPLLAWEKTAPKALRRNFPIPLLAALAGLSIGWAAGAHSVETLLSIALAAFVIAATLLEFFREIAARRKTQGESHPIAVIRLFRMNRRRYGGSIVHLGIVAMALGLTGAAFNTHVQGNLREGESLTLGPYRFQCNRIRVENQANLNYAMAFVELDVFKNGQTFTRLLPEKRFYFASEQTTGEVALHSTLREDLYAVLAGLQDDGSASLQIYRNPLVAWIWLGGILMAIGTGIALIPARGSRKGLTTIGAALILTMTGIPGRFPSAYAQIAPAAVARVDLPDSSAPLQVHLSILMLGELNEHTLVVQKRFQVINESNEVYPEKDGIALYVPDSVIGDVTATIDRGGVKSEIQPVADASTSIYRIHTPVEPGELTVDVRYRIHYHPNEQPLQEVFLYPTHAFPLFVFPPSLEAESDRIQLVSRQERMNRYQTTQGFQAGEVLHFILRDTTRTSKNKPEAGAILERPNRLQEMQLPLIAGLTVFLLLTTLGGLTMTRRPETEENPAQLEKQAQVLQDTLQNLVSQRQAGLLDEKTYRERQSEAHRKLSQIHSRLRWKD